MLIYPNHKSGTVVVLFNLAIYLIIIIPSVDMQQSFFFKRVPGVDYDAIDVYITREDLNHHHEQQQRHPRHIQSRQKKIRPRMLQNPRLYQGDIVGPLPEVTHLIAALIDNLASSGVIPANDNDETSIAASNHHFRHHRNRGMDLFLWPRAVIPFVLDFNASKYCMCLILPSAHQSCFSVTMSMPQQPVNVSHPMDKDVSSH